MGKRFNKWIHLVKYIPNQLNKMECPRCNEKNLTYRYILYGEVRERLGTLDIWCDSCLFGIHISRVGIPEDVDYLTFNLDDNIIKETIPNFTWVNSDK